MDALSLYLMGKITRYSNESNWIVWLNATMSAICFNFIVVEWNCLLLVSVKESWNSIK